METQEIEFDINQVQTILKGNVKKTTEEDVCILQSARTYLLILWLGKRRDVKLLVAQNKKKQWQAKLTEKVENSKKTKREIEAEQAEWIYEDTKTEVLWEYDYWLYNWLREEITEFINTWKKLFNPSN